MSGRSEDMRWPLERRIARRFRTRINVFTTVVFIMIGLSTIVCIATFLMPGHPSGVITTYGHWAFRGTHYIEGSRIDLGESRDPPEIQARRSRAQILIGSSWGGGLAAAALFCLYANRCITNDRRRRAGHVAKQPGPPLPKAATG